MKRIFITGASGLLGSNLCLLARERFEVCGIFCRHAVKMHGVRLVQADLTRYEEMKALEAFKPSIIIHAAALANIDQCEENPAEARRQNVEASIHVAELAKKVGAYFIHISTDAVFFKGNGLFKEDDPPDPLSVYARTKFEAEQAVANLLPGAAVVRVNIYGWNKIDKFSLAEWMLDKLQKEEELPGFSDVVFSPMLVNHLAEFLFSLSQKGYEGLLHVTGAEALSKLKFAQRLAKVFGLNDSLIKPVRLKDLALRAPRGHDTSLDTSRAADLFKTALPMAEEGLREMKRLLDTGYVKRLKHDEA